jgi:hypothetical protein
MSLSLDEIRSMCTKAEFALISSSRSPAIEKLSSAQLKKNAANARRLSDKWQKLARGQSRTESRKTGSPNLDSKSYAKQQALHDALVAYEARLASTSTVATVEATAKKITPKQRTASARVSRQASRTELQAVKKTLNKTSSKSRCRSSCFGCCSQACCEQIGSQGRSGQEGVEQDRRQENCKASRCGQCISCGPSRSKESC